MVHKKMIIPSEIDALGVRPFLDVKEIQFSIVIALEDLNSGGYGLLFVFFKTNSLHCEYI
jgi:hypothetical protein